MNKLIVAMKENKDVRKKVIIATGITVAAVAAGIILAKMKDSTEKVLVITDVAAEAISDVTPE